nr:radical SAM protein [Methermicoccus shengliensis]
MVDFCQLNCGHCYLKKGDSVMPLDMIKNICIDFLKTRLPLHRTEIVLSGGDPLLHPNFAEICELVRKLNGNIRLSTNGILIPKYIHVFRKQDGVQVSVDGNEEVHDYIRGEGSYQKTVKALHLLDENGINHSIGFTLNRLNLECIDHIIDLCIETGCRMLNLNLYQPIRNSLKLEPVTFKKWLKVREYAIKKAEKEGIYIPKLCIERGCIAGVLGLSVLPSQTIKFEIQKELLNMENNWDAYWIIHTWMPTINSPPSPEGMTGTEREEYGIEEIPANKIKERAAELGLSPARVKELLELGEPLYVANGGVIIKKHPIRVFRTDLASFKDVSPGIRRALREINKRVRNE